MLNRLDARIVFTPLTPEVALAGIVRREFRLVRECIEQGLAIEVRVTEAALIALGRDGHDLGKGVLHPYADQSRLKGRPLFSTTVEADRLVNRGTSGYLVTLKSGGLQHHWTRHYISMLKTG